MALHSGHLIMGDSFKASLFKQTFQKVFSKDEQGDYLMAFNASVEVKVCVFPLSYIVT